MRRTQLILLVVILFAVGLGIGALIRFSAGKQEVISTPAQRVTQPAASKPKADPAAIAQLSDPGEPIPQRNLEWLDYEVAEQQAPRQGKRLLLYFYADDCAFCVQMEQETFADPAVQSTMMAYFLPVRLDARSTDPITYKGEALTKTTLAKKLVGQAPTSFFIEPTGEEIGGLPAYYPPAQYRAALLYFKNRGYSSTVTFDEYLKGVQGGR